MFNTRVGIVCAHFACALMDLFVAIMIIRHKYICFYTYVHKRFACALMDLFDAIMILRHVNFLVLSFSLGGEGYCQEVIYITNIVTITITFIVA